MVASHDYPPISGPKRQLEISSCPWPQLNRPTNSEHRTRKGSVSFQLNLVVILKLTGVAIGYFSFSFYLLKFNNNFEPHTKQVFKYKKKLFLKNVLKKCFEKL